MGIRATRVDGITHLRITAPAVKARWDSEKEQALRSARFCLSKAEFWQQLPPDEGFGQCSSNADKSHSQCSDVSATIGG